MKREQFFQLWNRFAMVQTISNCAKREGFQLGYRLIARPAIDHDTGNFRDFSEPTPVFFLFKSIIMTFTSNGHGTAIHIRWQYGPFVPKPVVSSVVGYPV